MVTIIHFPLLFIDKRCQRTINKKIIWKCEHLLDMIKEPDLIMDEKESIPQQIDSDFIILGGWEFNVSSTIYANATPEEVIGGWNMLNKDIPDDVLNRLIQPFFVRALLDVSSYPIVELREQEPEMNSSC